MKETNVLLKIDINIYWLLLCIWNLTGIKTNISNLDIQLYPHIISLSSAYPDDINIIRPSYAILSNLSILGLNSTEIQLHVVCNFTHILDKLSLSSQNVINVMCSCIIIWKKHTTVDISVLSEKTIYLLLYLLENQRTSSKNVQILSMTLVSLLEIQHTDIIQILSYHIEFCLELVQLYKKDKNTLSSILSLIQILIIYRINSNEKEEDWVEYTIMLFASALKFGILKNDDCEIEILKYHHICTTLLLTYPRYIEVVIDSLCFYVCHSNLKSTNMICQIILTFIDNLKDICKLFGQYLEKLQTIQTILY
jgi:hypothetical protein